MAELLTPDICVIGAGSGGLSVAAAAAAFGVPVVLIEKGRMGGECLNAGCVPSKALIAAAKRAQQMRDADAFGVSAQRVTVDFGLVHDHIQAVIAAIAPNDSKERFTGLGVRVIEGEGRFSDANTVTVGDIEIKARRFVIAAGSSPALPAIEGLDDTPHFTNETIFDLRVCPKHLIVIGAGPVGLELAQAFRRLGADVTVLEVLEPLAQEDPECASIVLDQLARDGVVLRRGVSIAHVHRARTKVLVVLRDGDTEETIEGSHLLIATGRRANVAGLGLDKAGIRYDMRGITVDKGLKTSNSRVYAIGDIAGGPQFTHVANYHAGLVIRNALFRLPVKVRDEIVPRVTFTDPELAHVGLMETQAGKRRDIRIARWPYHDNDRAQTERVTLGHIKVVMDTKGTVLGVTIVGTQAGELITLWALAIGQRLNIRTMTDIVMPYPVLSEIGKRAAISHFARRLTSPWVHRIIVLLRRLG